MYNHREAFNHPKSKAPWLHNASVAHAESLAKSTVQGWVKNIAEIENAIEFHGEKKAFYTDKTPTLTRGLKAFCEKARTAKPPFPITIQSISVKAKLLSE